MSPVAQVDDLQRPSHFVPFDPALAPRLDGAAAAGRSATPLQAGELDLGALLRFKSMMALEGQAVQLARLCHDRQYAYERIAAAHACRDEGLRRLALELFQITHRRESAGVPAQ